MKSKLKPIWENKKIIQALMDATVDSYSRGRYGEGKWRKSIVQLLIHFTPNQVQWILDSKHMRWAADSNETSRGVPADTMQKWVMGGNLDNEDQMPPAVFSIPYMQMLTAGIH